MEAPYNVSDLPIENYSHHTRKDVVHMKERLEEVYASFCERFRSLSNIPPGRPVKHDTVLPIYKYDILIRVLYTVLRFPDRSKVFYDDNTNQYITGANRRLYFIFGDDQMPLLHEGRKYPQEATNATQEQITRWGETLCNFVFVNIEKMRDDLISPLQSEGKSKMENLPPEMWKYLMDLIKETQEEQGMVMKGMLPVLSKSLALTGKSAKNPVLLKAKLDDRVKRYMFNYLVNMGFAFDVIIYLVNSSEYNNFEANETNLSNEEMSIDKMDIEESRLADRSLHPPLRVAWINTEESKYKLVVTLIDTENESMKIYHRNLVNDIKKLTRKYSDTGTPNETNNMWIFEGVDPDVLYVILSGLLDSKPPDSYEYTIALRQGDELYTHHRERSEAIKKFQFYGYRNRPFDLMLLCTSVNQQLYGYNAAPNSPSNLMHLFIRRSELKLLIERDMSKTFFRGEKLSNLYKFNLGSYSFSTKDINGKEQTLYNIIRFYSFDKEPDWEHWSIPKESLYMEPEYAATMNVADMVNAFGLSSKFGIASHYRLVRRSDGTLEITLQQNTI